MSASATCRTLLLRPLTCLWVGLLPIAWAAAQDPAATNPFGQNPNPFGTPPASAGSPFGDFGQPADASPAAAAAGANEAQLAEDPDPVVRLLRADPPRTPAKFADGLTWMVRIKRWDEVRRLLDELSQANWSLEQQAELTRAAGSSLWLRIRSDEAELTDAQRELVGNLLAAPRKLSREPAWLDQWITKLGSTSPGERRLAQLRLQDGGMVAIQRLVERLLAGDNQVASGILAATLVEFGRDGVEALQAATLVGDPERAGRVFLALAELPGKQFSAELGAGLESRALSAATREQLRQLVSQRYGKVPTPAAIAAFLDQRFDEQLADYQQARAIGGETYDYVWRPTADQQSIQVDETQTQGRALEALARLAAHRSRLASAGPAEMVENGAVLLQRAYQVAPGLEAAELESNLLVDINPAESREPAYWIRVFDQAGEWQMHGGAMRSLQMMVESAAGEYQLPIDFLTRLLRDSRPMVRYAALENLATIDPKQSYAGAAPALETAFEMVQLGSGPHVLVIGLQSEFRQAAQQQLMSQAGAEVTHVNSARAALQALESPTPIELIVVVDRVADQSLFELLQRLRNSARGGGLPIAVLTDQLYQHEREWIAKTPGVVSSVLSTNAEHMRNVLIRMLDTLDTAPLEPSDREHFALLAAQFLARVASDRDVYAFYPLADWHDQLQSIGEELPPSSQVALLAGVGSAASQRQLAELAADSNLSETDRLAAARGFGKSVRRFGLNLDRQDVLRTYDLYNTLGPSDPASVKSLGLALDVVEAHAGKSPWPEGF